MADEKSLWADPAIWISLAAFGVSAFQATASHLNNKNADKRTKFIESISVEFATIEASLDLLEQTIVRARRNESISSSDLAGLAIKAMRSTTRSLNKISAFNSVDSAKIETKQVDALDDVLNFANDGIFEGDTRQLHLETSQRIVARISVYCMDLHRIIQGSHL